MNEFKIKNGLIVSGSADIENDLIVRGTLTANQIDISIVSSSVLYQSGSTTFGDSQDDTHLFTGAVNVTGSISLNGQQIGTGKLDITTFNAYTASNNTTNNLQSNQLSSIQTATASLNSFTSSINTTIKSKLNADNVISSSTQLTGAFDQRYIISGTITQTTWDNIANKPDGIVSGSVQVDISSTTGYSNFSSSISGSITALSSSVAATDFTQSARLDNLEIASGSIRSDLNTYTSSANGRISSLETASGSIRTNFNSYTSSANSRLTLIETSTGSLNSFSSSISTRVRNLETASGSLQSYTSSANTRFNTIELTTSSLNDYTSSTNDRLSLIEISTGSLEAFTSSINTTIDTELNTKNVVSSSAQIFITGTTGYSAFSSSISSSINSLSSSVATTTANLSSSVGSISSSINTRINNVTSSIGSISSSLSSTDNTLSSSIGSLSSSVAITTAGLSSSIGSLSSSIATTDAGQNTRLGFIETSTSSLNTFSSSAAGRLDSLESASSSIRSDFNTYTSSNDSRLTTIEGTTGSLNSFTSSINTTIKNKLNADGVISGSIQVSLTGTTGYSTFSSSVATTDAGIKTRLNNLEGLTGSYATTGSNTFIGNQTVTGSLLTSGSNTLIGTTLLSGSITISGSVNPATPTVKIFGDLQTDGVIKFDPVSKNIDTSISASYIFVSSSTQDLYFSQNGSGYNNVTRLRWLEGNLYTGILKGGVLTSVPGSNTFNITSGEGIIVSLNASTGSDPYPTIKQVTWGTQTNIPITYSGSAPITYVGIDNTGTVIQQTSPWGTTDINQFDSQIAIGTVLTLSGSVSSGVFNAPQTAYGTTQKTDDFMRSFGPLKISGHSLIPSGSSPTLSLTKTGGTAYRDGANYLNNPNHPSTVVEGPVSTSKIYRYYLSGSVPVIDTGINNAGYTTIDNTKYVDTTTGNLATVGNSWWSIQRVFWIVNSPTNAFIVYYGNARYTTLLNALNAKDNEPFTEAPNTATNAIFLGYIIVEGGSGRDLLNSSETTIIQGGLFRAIGGVGSSGTSAVSTQLSGLADVNLTSLTSGDLLVYGGGSWNNKKSLNGNYAITGSLNVSAGITGSIDFSNITNKPTLVSGSSQIDITSTTNYTTFSSSISTSIGNLSSSIATTNSNSSSSLGLLSSSIATTTANISSSLGSISSSFSTTIGSLSSSVATTTANVSSSLGSISSSFSTMIGNLSSSVATTTLNLSSSVSTSIGSLSSSVATTTSGLSSSIGSLSSSIATTDANQNTRLGLLETSTGSLNSFTSSINTTIKSKLNTEGVISGSIQVDITATTNYTTFSSSIATTTSNLSSSIGSLSSSIATTDSTQNGRLNSLETSTGSLNTFTSSATTRLNTIETTTGSLNTFTSSAAGRLTSLESASSSIRSNFNSYTSSNNTVIGTLQVATSSLNSYTASNDININAIQVTTGSLNSYTSSANTRFNSLESASGSIRSDFNSYTASVNPRLTSLEGTTGSIISNFNSYTSSANSRLSSIEISTSSLNSFSSSINSYSASINSFTSSINTFTSSYTTGSFTGSFKGDGTNLYNIPASGVTGLQLYKIVSGSVSASISPDKGLQVNTDLTVSGIITAREIHTSYVTSSVLYESGSTNFGDTLDDYHNFTGSVNITGSIYLNGNLVGTGKLDSSEFYTYTSSITPRVNSLETFSGSAITRLNAIESTTGSLNTFTSSVSGRLNSIEGKTGSFATTGSNTFIGNEVISGSLAISGALDLTNTNLAGIKYLYTTPTYATTWSINHGLGYDFPNVIIYDGNKHVMIPDEIISIDSNNIQVTFATAEYGSALISVSSLSTATADKLIFTQTGSYYNTQYNIGITGSLRVTGDVDAANFNTTSDKKLKTNLERIERALDKIEKLNGYTFDWLEEYSDDRTRQIGMVADEVYEVQPELIAKRTALIGGVEEEIKLLDYSKVTALLLEGIKELSDRVTKLESKKKKSK